MACTLFSLGLLGAAHERRLWKDTIGPQIEPKVLPHVFDGIDQTVQRVFGSSSAGLPWAGHSAPGGLGVVALILRWPAAIALVAFAFELIVRYAPAKHQRTRWASFGSVLVVIGWIGETLIFGLDELVREDLQRPPSKRRLLPLALGVNRGEP